jgi:D-glycero-alpha-D-manno-heptose 1-phosphate guanylyltransferase
MAPVAGRPFLEYLLSWLSAGGVTETVIATGCMGEKINAFFGDAYAGMKIVYSHEETPLLTGGAIKKALTVCSDELVFIANGDTYFDVSLRQMCAEFDSENTDMVVAVKEMKDFERYGSLSIENGMIVGFHEKKPCRRGYINGGIYLLRRSLLDGCPDVFSMEMDFMERKATAMRMKAFVSEGYFIDIGVPEDYEAAQSAFLSRALW